MTFGAVCVTVIMTVYVYIHTCMRIYMHMYVCANAIHIHMGGVGVCLVYV